MNKTVSENTRSGAVSPTVNDRLLTLEVIYYLANKHITLEEFPLEKQVLLYNKMMMAYATTLHVQHSWFRKSPMPLLTI